MTATPKVTAEVGTDPKCPNDGHRLQINNEVTGEMYCPECKWLGYVKYVTIPEDEWIIRTKAGAIPCATEKKPGALIGELEAW